VLRAAGGARLPHQQMPGRMPLSRLPSQNSTKQHTNVPSHTCLDSTLLCQATSYSHSNLPLCPHALMCAPQASATKARRFSAPAQAHPCTLALLAPPAAASPSTCPQGRRCSLTGLSTSREPSWAALCALIAQAHLRTLALATAAARRSSTWHMTPLIQAAQQPSCLVEQ
jgi:hypothetical protein